MNEIRIGTRREVCWDEFLMDRCEGITVLMHRPEYRGLALYADRPWEGNVCGYPTVVEDGGLVRFYYRGADIAVDENLVPDRRAVHAGQGRFCYAVSTDGGKSFRRQPAGITGPALQPGNNCMFTQEMDNFSVFLDDNPACPAEERYKGLCGICSPRDQHLELYVSADGIHFTRKRILADDGAYDSLNVAFWDPQREQYFLYYRGIHHPGTSGDDGKWHEEDDSGKVIRDIRVRTSRDFIHWSKPKLISFDRDCPDYQLYTNQVRPYPRAPHIFLGMPTRYTERLGDQANFPHLPAYRTRRALTAMEGRSGYAMTDCVLMTSRDGFTFRRSEEAFLTPGPECGNNWFYGNCYPAYGVVETESDRPGFPNEISVYVGEGYRTTPVRFQRYAVRLDGFFSWRGDGRGGTVLTKPVLFDGASLEVNFATSALGSLRIRLCGKDGEPLEGYDSGNLFGDSVQRTVDFHRPVSALAGTPVRLEISLRDADLYSFRFCPAWAL